MSQPNKEYIYSGSQLLATVDASTGLSYQFPDHLSTRVEADSNGAITRTFGHFPFGDVWYETGTASKWKFTTYERDSESQLDYAQFRFYSSRLGRFTSSDPLPGDISNPEAADRFSYVLNQPTNAVDPAGLDTCFVLTFLDGAPVGPLCFPGDSWIWFPIPIPGPGNNGNGGGGGDPGSGGRTAPPLRGERLGIPNGLELPRADPLGGLLPLDSSCDFGVCTALGFNTATDVLPRAVPLCVLNPEVCVIGLGIGAEIGQMYLFHLLAKNIVENAAFGAAVRAIERICGRKLDAADRRRLHDEITGLGLSYPDIVDLGVALFCPENAAR